MKRHASLILFVLLAACARPQHLQQGYIEIEPGLLPPAKHAIEIPGLGPCTDNPERSLHLHSGQPVTVLVHGMYSSSGELRGLAQIFAFHGQQTACFSYDDRAPLNSSAIELRLALNELIRQTNSRQITVIGHSLGALIGRKSLTPLPDIPLPPTATDLRLVTISGPFDGIASARDCNNKWLRVLTLGLMSATCHAITGEKWEDITAVSSFIRAPGVLIPQLRSYLKIDTDERNSCREMRDSYCFEDDFVFSLAEQRNALVENDARMRRLEVVSGHIAIVGNRQKAPLALVSILQQQGILNPTPPERLHEFTLMLARAYQEGAPQQGAIRPE